MPQTEPYGPDSINFLMFFVDFDRGTVSVAQRDTAARFLKDLDCATRFLNCGTVTTQEGGGEGSLPPSLCGDCATVQEPGSTIQVLKESGQESDPKGATWDQGAQVALRGDESAPKGAQGPMWSLLGDNSAP